MVAAYQTPHIPMVQDLELSILISQNARRLSSEHHAPGDAIGKHHSTGPITRMNCPGHPTKPQP